MVPVTVEGAVPLWTLQNTVVRCRLAPKSAADPQGFFQIPRQHLPFLRAGLVIVHVVVLGASVLVQQQCLDCHVLNELHHDQSSRSEWWCTDYMLLEKDLLVTPALRVFTGLRQCTIAALPQAASAHKGSYTPGPVQVLQGCLISATAAALRLVAATCSRSDC